MAPFQSHKRVLSSISAIMQLFDIAIGKRGVIDIAETLYTRLISRGQVPVAISRDREKEKS